MNFYKIYTRLPYHTTVRARLSVLVIAAAAALTACGQHTASSTADYIGIDAAKEAAFQSADISAEQATLLSAGLDSKNGTFYYEVIFQENGVEYEYDIDALTGVVIEEKHTYLPSENLAAAADTGNTAPQENASQQNADSGQDTASQQNTDSGQNAASQQNTDSGQNTASQQNTDSGQNTASQQNAGSGQNAASQQNAGSGQNAASQQNAGSGQNAASRQSAAGGSSAAGIDSDTAFSIALSHAGLTESDVTFHQVKEDLEDGKRVLDVEFISSNGTEYDYELSAEDGTILSYDYDAESQFRGVPSAGAGIISEEQAKQTVLERVPGASTKDIAIHLEEDDGRMEYEGKLFYDNTEYEFKIDAYSGGLIEWEAESFRTR